MQLVVTLAAATVGGLALERLHVPGGLIFGSMTGAAVVTLARGDVGALPGPLRSAAFIVLGAAIGIGMTRSTVASLRSLLAPALLSAALIILAGLGIAYLLRLVGLAPPGDVLATSPGALSVVSALAVQEGLGAVEVALFHLVRVVMVILSLPVVVHLLTRPGR
ncbi:MAG: AbrB family transcriptional regulator [Actinomycetota bacterium]|nr:AbrB family transcriptional regulator [Actinomycetota bacterium]